MALLVRLDGKNVPTVKFFRDKKPHKLLCELPILIAKPASVGLDQGGVPEERATLGE